MPVTRFVPRHIEAQGLEAIEEFKDASMEADAACRTPECTDRNDDGDGWNGYCGNCADRRDSKTSS